MRKLKASIAAIVAATVIGVGVTSAPAQAVLSDCTAYSDVVCLWKNGGQGGSIWRQTRAQIQSAGCRNLTEAGWNDAVTSFRNQTSSAWVMELFWNAGCTGTPIQAFYGFNYDLTGNGWDNQISSIRVVFAP